MFNRLWSLSTLRNFVLSFVCSFTLSGVVFAQAASSQTYCGSGFTEQFVPDRFIGCDFSEACKAHDICYGRCDKGGDRFGTAYCAQSEQSPERVAAKKTCDENFRQAIIKANPGKSRCEKFAGLYAGVVGVFGQGPFNGKVPPAALDKIVANSNTTGEIRVKTETLLRLERDKKIDLTKAELTGRDLVIRVRSETEPNAPDRKVILRAGDSKEKIQEIRRAIEK
jgi:hypothetical protein